MIEGLFGDSEPGFRLSFTRKNGLRLLCSPSPASEMKIRSEITPSKSGRAFNTLKSIIAGLFGSQFRRNMFSGLATNIMNTVLMLVTYPLYLHYLGYEKLGVWIILSAVLSFMQLSNLGLGPAVTKLVAEEYGRGNIQGVMDYVRTALGTVFVTGVLAFTVLLLFCRPLVGIFKLGPDNSAVAVSLVPFIGILTVYAFLIQILTAMLAGLGRIDQVNYRDTACRAVSLVVAAALLITGYGIESLLIASAVSSVAMHTTSLALIRKIISSRILVFTWNLKMFRTLISYGGAVFGCSLISMLFSPFNKLLLSRYAGVAVVPVYEIAFNASMQVRNLMETAFRAIIPEVSRISNEITAEAKERILRIYRHAMRLVYLGGAPIYLTIAILSPFLFKAWLRGSFTESLPRAFCIMLIGTFLSLKCVPAYYTLMGLGRMKHCLISQVILGGVNGGLIGVIVLFSRALSLDIVASTTALAMGVMSIYLTWAKSRVIREYLEDPLVAH
jgi:O-antigen/teichoic acid export membrane protein